ncbi:class I SAM-dependent RNA methyltransferase [Candidatus Haliotispira prima]|uniref:Class I SAM-dependent RNA methyltransferase n=1 Tax=Candidatus Haliotispira prima TaxID=3034016 RepID=A0ABY8MDS9_9SPIO|nr:class I SAM-dependent RNA methyltransferase [Candidatus Haliotispira prima]
MMESEQKYQAIALCIIGLEKILQDELRCLKLPTVQKQAGILSFSGSLSDIFCANFSLRSAERVLLEVLNCEVTGFDDLFEALQNVAWEQFFSREDSLVVERVRIRSHRPDQRAGHSKQSQEKQGAIHSQVACQSVVHKAIYGRLSQHYGLERLPESGVRRSLRVYIENRQLGNRQPVAICRITLDCSGDALHRRSYRKFTGPAPLKESIAAGLLLFSGWHRRIPLLDPFCGSGTLAIEAALFGLGIAPGLHRRFAMESFPLLHGPNQDRKQNERIADLRSGKQEEAKKNLALSRNPESDMSLRVFASDCDARTLEGAKANTERAGLAGCIQFCRAEARQLQPPAENGLLLSNPPYGQRLGDRQSIRRLYAELGDLGRDRFSQWALGFISGSPDFEYDFAGTADRQYHLVNGQEDQFFYYYAAP